MTTILVADDERDIRDRLADTLTDAGYGVIQAKDGGDALAKAWHEHPDIILLDVMMPVMDGFEVLRRLKKREEEDPATQSIPVILLTSLAPEEGEQAAISMGASHYLTKDWEPGMVEAAVRVALRDAGKGTELGTRPEAPPTPSTVGNRRPLLNAMEDEIGRPLIGSLIGSLTLVDGPPSSGKTVLCQHLAHQALQEGRSVAYFTSERTIRGLVAHMGALGFDVAKEVQARRMLVYPIPEPAPGINPDHLMTSLAQDISRLPARYDFIVVDAITYLASYAQERALTSFMSSCKVLCDDGRSIILVAHPELFEAKTMDRLEVLCDTHLRLRSEQMGSKTWRMLQVRKTRSAEADSLREVSFQVVPGLGVQTAPFRRVRV